MNREIIMERLKEMDENIALLEEIKSTPLEEFCNEPRIYKLAERCLQLCIECISDICHYMISQNNWPRPSDDAEAILVLATKGIIPKDFAESIMGMPNFRNILVHDYIKIDRKIVYQNMQRIDDFKNFAQYILDYLKK